MSDNWVNFACRHCGAEQSAPVERSGKTMVCQACNSQVVVPAEDDEEEYRLLEGIDQPESDQEYIPVVFELCKTRMYATVDQIGQTLCCPDCGRENLVKRLADPVESKFPLLAPDYQEGYDVVDEIVTAVPIVEAPDGGILACSVCGASLVANGEKPGQQIFCQRCGTSTIIPNPDEEQTNTAIPFQPPALKYLIHPGVLNFPFYAGCWSRLWIVTATGSIAVIMGTSGIMMALLPGGAGAVFGVCAYALAFLLAAGSFVVLSVFLLAVLLDTSEDCDAIENWPDRVWIDWIMETFYVFNSLALSGIPGFLIGFLIGFSTSLRDYAALLLPCSVFVLFPIILLCLQESNSAMQPFSFPVMRSLGQSWRAWITFYALTAGLLLGTAALSILLMLVHPVIAVVPSLAVMVYTAMVYFRMLGRLTRFVEAADTGINRPRRR